MSRFDTLKNFLNDPMTLGVLGNVSLLIGIACLKKSKLSKGTEADLSMAGKDFLERELQSLLEEIDDLRKENFQLSLAAEG